MESPGQPSDRQDRLWLLLLEEEGHPPDNDCRMQQEPQSRHLGSQFVYKMRHLHHMWFFPAQKFPKPVNRAWQAVSLWCLTVGPVLPHKNLPGVE